jgi:hypothetical protein
MMVTSGKVQALGLGIVFGGVGSDLKALFPSGEYDVVLNPNWFATALPTSSRIRDAFVRSSNLQILAWV